MVIVTQDILGRLIDSLTRLSQNFDIRFVIARYIPYLSLVNDVHVPHPIIVVNLSDQYPIRQVFLPLSGTQKFSFVVSCVPYLTKLLNTRLRLSEY